MVFRKIVYPPDPVCPSCGHLGSKHDPDPRGGTDGCPAEAFEQPDVFDGD